MILNALFNASKMSWELLFVHLFSSPLSLFVLVMTFQVSFIMLLVDIWRKRTKSKTLEGHLTWDRTCHDCSGWRYNAFSGHMEETDKIGNL